VLFAERLAGQDVESAFSRKASRQNRDYQHARKNRIAAEISSGIAIGPTCAADGNNWMAEDGDYIEKNKVYEA
jgi:hypothetical protein